MSYSFRPRTKQRGRFGRQRPYTSTPFADKIYRRRTKGKYFKRY